jgi:hypothetical protein
MRPSAIGRRLRSGNRQEPSVRRPEQANRFYDRVCFLERNGLHFTASEADVSQAILELAAGTIHETGFALFLRDHVKPARKRKSSR